jgi:hypothetical protein
MFDLDQLGYQIRDSAVALLPARINSGPENEQ